MIWHITCKEILENFLSLRFVLSLLLTITLFATIGFVFVDKYEQQSQDYWEETNKNLSAFGKQSNQLYKLAFYTQEIYREPKLFTLCADGFEESLPNYFRFNIFTIDLPELRGQSNFILPHFKEIDWVFMISLFLSFLTLIFVYNSFCGEKEAGTLCLMVSGSVPRYKILLGKYFGVMFTLGIPLLLGLLVNLMIVISYNVTIISGLDWLRILMIILLSFAYLSVFVLLGMCVSSRTAHLANSMVILLLIWVCTVILMPSFGRIISDALCRSPSGVEFERKKSKALEQVESYRSSGKYGEKAGARYSNPDHPSNNPPGRARYCNALTDAENRVIEEHHNKMLAQAYAGRNLTCISPVIIYQRAAELIAGTGINRSQNLYQQIKRYQANLKEYIQSKDLEDHESLHLLFDEEHTMVDWNAISNNPVDFDSVPKFQERDLGLGESLQLAIWDIGLLVLFNLAFFAAAFVSFLRYDVR